MRVLDLFSGIGGFSLGLERAGFETIAFCEIEPYCRAVLRKHWPKVPCYEDIRELTGEQIGPVDVICGGFPCKNTSVAAAIWGGRSGLDGEDSGLWWEYIRLVRESRPTWVLVENPPGVKKWRHTIKAGLEGLGYRVSQSEFEASDFGLPHKRRRVFFAANRDGKGLSIPRPTGSWETVEGAWRTPARDFWRETEPGIMRMDDGLSCRMERLRALGNAVVPQIPEMIGRAIMKADLEFLSQGAIDASKQGG